jgi:hypothetical protein
MRIARVGALSVATLLACLTAAQVSWAAPINDDFSARLPLLLGVADMRSNVGATVEPGERLTANDPSGFGCGREGGEAADGVPMANTMWWTFTGSGGPVTVSTRGSNVDTVLAVYEGGIADLLGCNDDLQPIDPTRPNLHYDVDSELLVDTVAGRQYTVQVGACTPVPPETCGTASGNVTLRLSGPPANDNRAAARVIAAGNPISSNNTGATVENSENTFCGSSHFAKTVWFRYTAPAIGTAVISAAGFDTVLAIYREGSTVPVDCNDDSVKGESGASRLPPVSPAGSPVPLTPGDYLIQVGGYYEPGFSGVAAENGPLEVQLSFDEDTDVDDDGVDREHDCNDANPGIRPGLPDIPNNSVDENCDGVVAFDRDGDGFLAPPAGEDCDDGNPAIHPGAAEKPGNKADENCDHRVAPAPLMAAVLGIKAHRIRGDGSQTWIDELSVQNAPKGAQIEVRCRGGGCPFGAMYRSVPRAHATLVVAGNFRLEPGDRLDVLVTKQNWIGRGRAFLIRRGKPVGERNYCVDSHGNRREC